MTRQGQDHARESKTGKEFKKKSLFYERTSSYFFRFSNDFFVIPNNFFFLNAALTRWGIEQLRFPSLETS